MKPNEATAFEWEYYEVDGPTKGRTILKARKVLKPKPIPREYNGTTERANKGVVWTKMTPKMEAEREAAEAWRAERTWVHGQGWVLLEDGEEE